MQRYLPGKLVKETPQSLIREARDSRTNAKVNIVELRATTSLELRRCQEEVDIQRCLSSSYTCRLIEVDMVQEQGGKWIIRLVREHCGANLGAEIKKRKAERRPWTQTELLQIAKHLIEVLAELQLKGAHLSKITLKSVLVRSNGDVILGSYRWAKVTSNASQVSSSVEKLGLVLGEMVALRHDEAIGSEVEQFMRAIDWTHYPDVSALVTAMRTPRSHCDFVKLLDMLDSSGRFISGREVPAARVPPHIPPNPFPSQYLPANLTCAACNKQFTHPSFNPAELRSTYQHYSHCLDKVCSVVCLDTYIRYTNTARKPAESCMMCQGTFDSGAGDWRRAETIEMKNFVCSRVCLSRAMTQILAYPGAN
jgi:hypothetical protein